MSDAIQTVLIILSPAVTTGAVAFLSKAWISHTLEKELIRFEKQYTSIYNKKSLVISELYEKLAEASILLKDLVKLFHPAGQDLKSKKENAWIVWKEAEDYFIKNKLLLSDDTADKIELVIEEMISALAKFDTAQLANDTYQSVETGMWKAAHEKVNQDLPPILESLKSEFRKELGVNK